jgi:hypothetical protein
MDKDLTGLQDWKPTDEEPEQAIIATSPDPTQETFEPILEVPPSPEGFKEPVSTTVPTEGSHNVWALGPFDASASEKILSFFEKIELGVTREQLETQLRSGQLLIPRVNEYVAVLLGRLLKDHVSDLRISLMPLSGVTPPPGQVTPFPSVKPSPSPLAPCPLKEGDPPPHAELKRLFTGCLLKPEEAEDTTKMNGLLTELKQQLERQASHLKASGLYHFKVDQAFLPHAGLYRLTATAEASHFSLAKDPLDPSP